MVKKEIFDGELDEIIKEGAWPKENLWFYIEQVITDVTGVRNKRIEMNKELRKLTKREIVKYFILDVRIWISLQKWKLYYKFIFPIKIRYERLRHKQSRR